MTRRFRVAAVQMVAGGDIGVNLAQAGPLVDDAARAGAELVLWDGTGYPYGIRGAFIPVGARILAIADAFDAIRVPLIDLRDARTRVALRILLVASGTQFDPGLVTLLCRQYGSFPSPPVSP